MDKKLVVFIGAFVLSTGLVFGQETKSADMADPAADEMAKPAAIEIGNTICPLTGRELNLNDPKDYTKLEVEGLSFNVCPKGKAAYDKDPSAFADKVSKAVADVEAANMPADNESAVSDESAITESATTDEPATDEPVTDKPVTNEPAAAKPVAVPAKY